MRNRKTMRKLSGWKKVGAAFLLSAAMAIVSSAQTLTTFADFNGSDGADPEGSVVQGTDGNFMGQLRREKRTTCSAQRRLWYGL
jgi:hypothetical protein